MSEQNRQHERVSAQALVRLSGDRAVGITRDLSPSGIFMVTTTPFEVGEELHFSIEFDNPADAAGKLYLSCTGSVVRVERGDDRIGVALTITDSKLERRERQAVEAAVAARARGGRERSQTIVD